MKEQHVIVEGDELRFVHEDELAAALADAGEIDVRRASHVEPKKVGGRLYWVADLAPVGGPLGMFVSRDEALEWEREELEAMGIPTPAEK